MKRIVSSLIIGLLFLSLFAFAFTLQTARAQSAGTIIINPDGSISSPTGVTANITTSDNVTYTFTGNNYLSIVVNRSNIIINGMGHTLQATGGRGFFMEYPVHNVTIEKTNITHSDLGIDLDSSYNDTLSDNYVTANTNYGIGVHYTYSYGGVTLSGNKVTANGEDGIYVEWSNNCTLSGNNVTANGDGIDLESSSDNNILSGNTVTANSYEGIEIASSSGNTLSGNIMANNTYNFGIQGSVLSDFMNNVSTSNLVNGKPVYYLMNESNVVISPKTSPEGAGYVGLVNCKNVTVQGLTLPENDQGILLAYTNDSTITHNNFTENVDGADIYYSSGDILSGNNIANNSGEGVYLYSSTHCTISGNNVTDNGDCGVYIDAYCNPTTVSGNNVTNNINEGVYLYNSSSCTVSGNNVTDNGDCGVYVDAYCNYTTVTGNNIANNINDGVYLYSSSNCTIFGNNVTRNRYGVGFISSSGNTLSGNTITGNSVYGIYLGSSSGNRIFHNDFLNNGEQAFAFNSTNTWDDGYPSGGNYWSDYRTTYPNASEVDSSAVWNASYFIAVNNTDRYPLMGPFHTFGVGTFNGTAYSVGTVCNSTITNLSFNAAAKTLSFNVTGTNGTAGFCRVAIPLSLMSGEWTVTVNGATPQNLNITIYGNYTYVYFTYHHSTETVKITSTNAIPEFPPLLILPLFMIVTLLAVVIYKKKDRLRLQFEIDPPVSVSSSPLFLESMFAFHSLKILQVEEPLH